MRGKETDGWKGLGEARITPAYAGKSWQQLDTNLQNEDHPRVCGEKCFLAVPCLRLQGSPPRMRGKAYELMPDWGGVRITPAYAGKSGLSGT